MYRRSSSYHFAGIVSMRETRVLQNSQRRPLYLPPTGRLVALADLKRFAIDLQ